MGHEASWCPSEAARLNGDREKCLQLSRDKGKPSCTQCDGEDHFSHHHRLAVAMCQLTCTSKGKVAGESVMQLGG